MSASADSAATPTYEVRAMSLAEILDTSFQLVKNAFLLLGGLAAIVYLPLSIIMGATAFGLDFETMEPEKAQQMLPVLGAVFVLYILAVFVGFPFVVGAVTGVAGRLFLGYEVSMRGAVRLGLARFVPLLWTYFLFTLAMSGVVMVAVVLALAASPLVGGLGNVVAVLSATTFILLFSVLFVYISAAMVLVAQVVVLEELSGIPALQRTWQLADGVRLRILGVMFTAGFLVFIPISGLQMMMNFLPVIGAVFWGLAQAIGYAFTSAVQVVLYFDIRCRKEAFDLEHLAQMVEGESHGAAPGAELL